MVALAAHDLEVFRPVVAPVTVDVVHDLARFQQPAQRLFCRNPVDPNRFAPFRISDAHVPSSGHKRKKRPPGR